MQDTMAANMTKMQQSMEQTLLAQQESFRLTSLRQTNEHDRAQATIRTLQASLQVANRPTVSDTNLSYSAVSPLNDDQPPPLVPTPPVTNVVVQPQVIPNPNLPVTSTTAPVAPPPPPHKYPSCY